MPSLEYIVAEQAQYVSNSGYEVVIDRSMPTVTLVNPDPDYSVFLDYEWADVFITKVDELAEQLPDVNEGTLELSIAKQYIDCL